MQTLPACWCISGHTAIHLFLAHTQRASFAQPACTAPHRSCTHKLHPNACHLYASPPRRSVCCFPDTSGYLVGSIEGRVAVHHVEDSVAAQKNFTFKCHREVSGGVQGRPSA